MQPISARQIRYLREIIREKKRRDAEQTFILEGLKPIEELLVSGSRLLQSVVVAQGFLDSAPSSLQRGLASASVPVLSCPCAMFERLTDVIASAGILAVVRQPSWKQEEVLKRPRLLALFGEALQDPANVGTIIRTAAAFGLDGVWLSEDSADPYNPKTVRAAVGTLLHIPVFRSADTTVLTAAGCHVVTMEVEGAGTKPIQEVRSLPARIVVCFGNESRGLRAATRRVASCRVHIPTATGVESLNVAASAAIGLFYFRSILKQDQSTASTR